jgi:hypothetical protein
VSELNADELIKLDRETLFDPQVDEALAKERARRERIIADAPPVSPVRRFLLNPLVYLPLAALIATLATYRMLDPRIQDMPVVGGEVILINAEPFDTQGMVALTIGNHEVIVDPQRTRFERGTDGQPPITSVDSIKVGDRIEATGIASGTKLVAGALRPTTRADSYGELEKPLWPMFLLFPLTSALIALGLLLAEGLTTRNYVRMIERSVLGSFLAALFATLAFIPAGVCMLLAQHFMNDEVARQHDALVLTVKDIAPKTFLLFTACRSAAWACIGAATGLGMNLVRATRTQLRNSVVGGAIGGAFGGIFFDPIDRWVRSTMFDTSSMSRLVGLVAVGLSIAFFVALVERLAREAWLRVRTGPLAGKSFILYKTPTVLGSAPNADVYLFKDAEIDATHAQIHRVGTIYEIEDMTSRTGTSVGGARIRRRRLGSGDQIIVGSTILEFEERQQRGDGHGSRT